MNYLGKLIHEILEKNPNVDMETDFHYNVLNTLHVFIEEVLEHYNNDLDDIDVTINYIHFHNVHMVTVETFVHSRGENYVTYFAVGHSSFFRKDRNVH